VAIEKRALGGIIHRPTKVFQRASRLAETVSAF
jgi:hypothetical protein